MRKLVGTRVLVGAGLAKGAPASAVELGWTALQPFVVNSRGWKRSADRPADDKQTRLPQDLR